MDNSGIAIKVSRLSKYYRLGVINSGTLKKDIQSWFYKKMGKEDPNSKLFVTADGNEADAEGFWALKDIDFEVHKGDRVGIIGKNGAGKSTLLKMISQISAPTRGKIYINGKIASLLEVGTGFNPELTGRENVYLNGAILGMKKAEVDRKIDEIIDFSGIGKYIDTPVKRYSSGMYVRLAFAVAAHLDSDILIADEVLAVGDADFQKKALGKMNQLSRGEGRTVLFVSHNMEAVKTLCNKGIVLDKGRLVFNSDIASAANFYFGTDTFQKHADILRNDFRDDFFFPYDVASFESYSILEDGKDAPYRIVYDRKSRYTLAIKGTIQKYKENLVIFYSLFKGEENIYTTDMYWSGDVKPGDLREGGFLLEFDLPFDKLTTGEYHVSISAVLHCEGWILQNEQNQMFFTLIKDFEPSPVYQDSHPMNDLSEGYGKAWLPGIMSFPCRTGVTRL